MVKTDYKRKKATFLSWKIKLLLLIIYFLAIFILEPLFRNDLMEFSIDFIEYIQDLLGQNVLQIAAIVSHLGSNLVFSIIFLITFSYTNIFKSYLLVIIVTFTNFLIGTLNLFYQDARPFYFNNNKIIPYSCKMSFGNPSAYSLSSMTFYLSLWHFSIQSKNLRNRNILKGFLLVTVMIINIIIMISEISSGAQSINQVLFGGMIGLGLYFTLFSLINIHSNDSKMLLSIITMKTFNYFLLNLFMSLLALIVIYLNDPLNNETRNTWTELIKNKCGYLYENTLFEKNDYLLLTSVFSNIFAFIGLKHEFIFTFKSSVNNWTKYNFSLEVKEVDSLFSSIDFTRDTQWNHNSVKISCLRLFVILIISFGIISPFFLICYDESFWLVLLVKILLPFSFVLYFLFFIVKLVLKFLRLVNFSSNDLLTSLDM